MRFFLPSNFKVLVVAGCLVFVGCNQKSTQDHVANSKKVLVNDLNPGISESSVGSRHRHPWSTETAVGQVVADQPSTARIFELAGIDYCCGGQKSIGVVADEENIDASQLLNALMVVGAGATTEITNDKNWQQLPLGELMRHIVDTHHSWLRQELPSLFATTQTVRRVHGDAHPELAEVETTLEQINAALLPHLSEEEESVFPAIEQLENGNPPSAITTMLESMRSDHDELGSNLHRLRKLTDGYAVPEDACAKYREMLTGLAALERDMLQHVHLENNILLPRALAMLEEN